MEIEEDFVVLTTLICEPNRAKMLWNLLDGRAYTAGELALTADVSKTSASNHLSKLLEAGIVKVQNQGRHRYFSFSKPEVAYVVESLANLAGEMPSRNIERITPPGGVKYCRTCYDHLAGYVGVLITEGMESNALIEKYGDAYKITKKGWVWLESVGVSRIKVEESRRPLTRQCLDWSERKPHLAGHVGALLLEKMFEKDWFRRVKNSRELVVTSLGSKAIYELLQVKI